MLRNVLFNRIITILWVFSLLLMSNIAPASSMIEDCYQKLNLNPPENQNNRTLLVLIDQTTALTSAMKSSVGSLVSDWGENGDTIKIIRFSANVRGQYTEMMFDNGVDAAPDEEYLYNLHKVDKVNLLECLKQQKQTFRSKFQMVLTTTLNMSNPTLPKSDILYSLKEISQKIIHSTGTAKMTVLLVSDGLENSDVISFHGKNTIKKIDPQKSLALINKKNLLTTWQNADIYIYGLGYIKSEKTYIRPALIEPLKEFWRLYFAAGKGEVKQLGTPELLLTSIK